MNGLLLIRIGESPVVQELVQKLLLKNGYTWGGGETAVVKFPKNYDHIGTTNKRMCYGREESFTDFWFDGVTKIDAETELGKLVKLLEEKPNKVKLNNDYTAVVGKTHTKVGDEEIPNKAILEVAAEIRRRGK